ncbi:MAG TPA: ATP-binding protein [Acidobacteriota bacterium]|nr:ATP-binding protein [Acidobacteriota bacterium]
MIRRNIEPLVTAALTDTPVVLINGARQTGKTTLVRMLATGVGKAAYFTLDDSAVLAGAVANPRGFLSNLEGTVIIDEVQKAPALFPAIKMAVDEDRRPGRFILTGSANVLMLPRLSESLAGRVEILTLRPFSQGEMEGRRETFVERLFSEKGFPVIQKTSAGTSLAQRIHRGGYPEAIRRSGTRRRAWFASYLSTILQRDIRDLSNIASVVETPRLLALLAGRSSALLNISELSRSAGIPHTSLQRYLALFEAAFLMQRIPAWTANLSKRLVKAPKALLGDTGFMAHLLNASEGAVLKDANLSGRFLETFVGCELLKQAEWEESKPRLMHYRTAAGMKVDFVLEEGGLRVAGVEVKSSHAVSARDFGGLRSLAEDAGKQFAGGVVLYGGEKVVPFGPHLWAVPISELWAG